MRPIPKKIRNRLSDDPFMATCIHNNADCKGRVEWEHAFIYAGRQINEEWAIVPCCTYHHRGDGLDKNYNQYRALQRATDEDLAKYLRVNWDLLKQFLKHKYGEFDSKVQRQSRGGKVDSGQQGEAPIVY